MGDAVARVSRGHGIDIAELDKENEFPMDFSVHGLNVNLRGLAVYVRLTDLLDIADDRTPYAVWKFVSPGDPKSAEEWSKHRALNPVTCPKYQNGRMVLVDGSTNDPDVWAALRDLERYVKDQVRECNDLLARMRDARFHLDLPIVEWRIATPGFTPVDLRFEFQRESMFRILSDEIYEGDVYVFLRELLQNSIDAMRLRAAILARDGLTMGGLVQFEVLHGENGSAIVRCRDNGIGMDVHIIRNYLALAGRSYYSSDEFRHLGLDIDAIARFGIGILSCFMAGESIEIETRRDPSLSPQSAPLRVMVPAVERQFRVYSGDSQQKIGTTITVNVCGKRIKSAPEGWNKKLRVADYLAEVGGFCEFPILVTEDGLNNLIIHPSHDESSAIASASSALRLSNESSHFSIRKAAQDYPWEEIFLAQDELKARNAFSVEWYDLQKDLKLAIGEGKIGVLVPKDQSLWAIKLEEPGDSVQTSFFKDLNEPPITARWYNSSSARRKARDQRPRSVSTNSTTHASCNGILVAGKESYEYYWGNLMPEAAIWINLGKVNAIQLNVARDDSKKEMAHWRKTVFDSLHHHILTSHIGNLINISPLERLHSIAKLMSWYEIEPETVGGYLPEDKWPIATFSQKRKLEVTDSIALVGDSWPVVPSFLSRAIADKYKANIYNWSIGEENFLNLWRGESCLVRDDGYFGESYEGAAFNFVAWAMKQIAPIERMRFISGPRTPKDVLPQLVRYRGKVISSDEVDSIAQLALSEPSNVPDDQWGLLSIFLDYTAGLRFDLLVKLFEAPYESYFACGGSAVNTKHPLVREVLRCAVYLSFAKRDKRISHSRLGALRDHLQGVLDHLSEKNFVQAEVQNAITSCMTAFNAGGLLSLDQGLKAPDATKFIPGSITFHEDWLELLYGAREHERCLFKHGFGKTI